jgi:hypothetical protein
VAIHKNGTTPWKCGSVLVTHSASISLHVHVTS